MSVTAGVLSITNVTPNSAQLAATAATAGTGPYTYQWYKSFTTGFTPGSAYLIPGATGLTLTEVSLLPATDYYYSVIVTDTGAGSATATYSQLTVLTTAGSAQDVNQFQQTPLLGQVTSSLNPGTRSAVVDGSYSTSSSFLPGTALKLVNANGFTAGLGLNTLPHVVPCTSATADTVFGFAQYSMKDQSFVTSSPLEVAQTSNTIYLMCTASGNLPSRAQLDLSVVGGVAPAVGSSGAVIVGDFIDQPVIGQLARVALQLVPRVVA